MYSNKDLEQCCLKVLSIFITFIFSNYLFAYTTEVRRIYFPEKTDMYDVWNETEIKKITEQFPFVSKKCFSFNSLNFGVLVNHEKHKIYRSQALGKMGIEELFSFLENHQLETPKTVIFMNKQGYKNYLPKNYFVNLSSRIKSLKAFAYEEATSFSEGEFSDVKFYHPLNHRVYLSGQDPLNDLAVYPIDQVAEVGIAEYFSNKHPQIKNITTMRSNFFRILNIILTTNEPVLFHCTGGLHRTGMIAMALRYLQGGVWEKPFKNPIVLRDSLSAYTVELRNLAEIEYYLHNPMWVRYKNILSMRTITQYDEFKQLKNKYRPSLNLPSQCLEL